MNGRTGIARTQPEAFRARFTAAEFLRMVETGAFEDWKVDLVDGERGVVHVHSEPVAGDHAEIGTVRFGQPLPVPGMDARITVD